MKTVSQRCAVIMCWHTVIYVERMTRWVRWSRMARLKSTAERDCANLKIDVSLSGAGLTTSLCTVERKGCASNWDRFACTHWTSGSKDQTTYEVICLWSDDAQWKLQYFPASSTLDNWRSFVQRIRNMPVRVVRSPKRGVVICSTSVVASRRLLQISN